MHARAPYLQPLLSVGRGQRLLVVQQVVLHDKPLPALALIEAVVVDRDDIEFQLPFRGVVGGAELHVGQKLQTEHSNSVDDGSSGSSSSESDMK